MSYKILIVDDSAMTRALVRRILRMAEIPCDQLYEASDGQAALDILVDTPVDLVLADLNMPVMDGFEMIRCMRADSVLRDIPIIVLSASPEAEVFARHEQ